MGKTHDLILLELYSVLYSTSTVVLLFIVCMIWYFSGSKYSFPFHLAARLFYTAFYPIYKYSTTVRDYTYRSCHFV